MCAISLLNLGLSIHLPLYLHSLSVCDSGKFCACVHKLNVKVNLNFEIVAFQSSILRRLLCRLVYRIVNQRDGTAKPLPAHSKFTQLHAIIYISSSSPVGAIHRSTVVVKCSPRDFIHLLLLSAENGDEAHTRLLIDIASTERAFLCPGTVPKSLLIFESI